MLIEKTETKTYTTRICDVCKKRPGRKKCIGCGIDLCISHECSTILYNDPWTLVDNGDYPDRVCNSCNEKLKAYKNPVQWVHEEFENKITSLEKQWKEECKSSRPSES